MSSSYYQRVFEAKAAAVSMMANAAGKGSSFNMLDVADTFDKLNKAWDEYTNALIREREERGNEVLRLLDQLAETKKGY